MVGRKGMLWKEGAGLGCLQGCLCLHLFPGSDLGGRDTNLQSRLDYAIGGGSNRLRLSHGYRPSQDHQDK